MRRACLLLFIVALAVRLTLLFGFHRYEFGRPEPIRIALSLARSGSFADPYIVPTGPTAHTAPFYPLLLAPIYRLLGDTSTADLVRATLNAAAASAGYALLPLLTVALGMGAPIGFMAGGVGALVPLHYWVECPVDFENVWTALFLQVAVLWFAWIVKRGRFTTTTAAGGGVLWGVGLLISPAVLPVMLALLGLLVLRARPAFRWFVTLGMAVFVAILPWSIRNYVEFRRVVFIRGDFGLELFVSNQDGASPVSETNFAQPYWRTAHPHSSPEAAAELNRVGEPAFERRKLVQALAWIRTHPRDFFILSFRRAGRFWFPSVPRFGWALWTVTILAAVGWVLLLRELRSAAVVLGVVLLSYAGIFVLIQNTLRYQHPVWWVLLILAVWPVNLLRYTKRLRFVSMRLAPLFLLVALSLSAQQPGGRGAQAPAAPQTIEQRVAGMQKLDGYFPLYWDERAGTLFLEIPRFDSEFLYTTGLAAGLGSNDIGLDRGQEGSGRIVSFQRVGPRVLLVQPNQSFRSSSVNAAERKSVEDSFAKSILWGFAVAAESNGHVLVDATDFILRDGHGAAAAIAGYRVDRNRSAVYMPRTKAFPKNTEIEVTLTFSNEGGAGGRGGGGGRGFGGLFSGSVSSVTPTSEAVTLREHYSLVELPDNQYKPRLDDPRAGFFGVSFVDYSTPIGEPMVKRFISRHRLTKRDPNAAVSEPVQPIRYWVDSGAPEDVRQALLEGARWWNQAFEAAGFRNAFQVEVLPEGADPMDIRYNMINWVHRSTRGWSMGGSVSDPRTGEIIKATVTLGSLRDRQDYMIFEGLLSPYRNGTEKPDILYQTALKRIRQLAAHEVGHTLGLGHNYYDSAKGWISVMDYPHPLEKLGEDGTIDLSDAYPARIGDWDKIAINYGYRQFTNGDDAAALAKILNDAWEQDLRYMTNQDTDSHPRVDQWSNGVNQADELNRLMRVRRAALSRLGEHTIRNGAPMATIEEPLVPIFLYHRYSVESAASMVGGLDYIYAVRGDGRTPVKYETAVNQRKALDALAGTLKPSELTVPKAVLDAIPPRPPGFGRHRELFPRTTGDGFDPISPATVAADTTIGFVLETNRAARMVAQHAVDPALPGLEEVIDRLTKATFDAAAASPYEQEIRRAEERVLADRVMGLAASSRNPQVRAIASFKLGKLAARLRSEVATGESEQAQRALIAADIKRFLERPAPVAPMSAPPEAPPGAPIGDPGMDWFSRPACGWVAPLERP